MSSPSTKSKISSFPQEILSPAALVKICPEMSPALKNKLLEQQARFDSYGRTLKLLKFTPRPLDADFFKSASIEDYEFDMPKRTSLEKPPPELCKSCSGIHSIWDICPGDSCSVCKSDRHYSHSCPYFIDLPKGAKFNEAKFTVHCRCGCPFFDTDEWACRAKDCVSTYAKLERKRCEICGAQHTTYECTEPEILIDQHRMLDELVYPLKPSKRSKRA